MKKTLLLVLLSFAVYTLFGQTKPRLAILPFTGGSPSDAESIAEFFSFQPEINQVFTPIPRTQAMKNVMKEQQFQRSGLTDTDTISKLGKQFNADYVLAGHITSLGTGAKASKLLLIIIVHVEQMRQLAGDYREYNRIEETIKFLPDMARRITTAIRQDATLLPKLAILPFNVLSSGINEGDAEVLAQILATDIANIGKYAVYPRTSTIERVMSEQKIQSSGMTDPENIKRIGVAVNAQYVLSTNIRSLGADKYFSALIINVENAEQLPGGRAKQYQNVQDGLSLMSDLAKEITGYIVGSWQRSMNDGTGYYHTYRFFIDGSYFEGVGIGEKGGGGWGNYSIRGSKLVFTWEGSNKEDIHDFSLSNDGNYLTIDNEWYEKIE